MFTVCFGRALRGQHLHHPQLQSDDEELEPPLPLRSDDEWPHLSPCLHHHYYNYGKKQCSQLKAVVSCVCAFVFVAKSRLYVDYV